MTIYFLCIIGIFFSKAVIGQEFDELILVGTLNILTETEHWYEAEEILDELLAKCPHPEHRENYYLFYDYVLEKEFQESAKKYIINNPMKTKSDDDSTVVIILSENLGAEATRILNKKIKIAKNYLEEFPSGKDTLKFQNILLSTYQALGKKENAIGIAKQLLHSNNMLSRLNAALALGYYAHASGAYNEAISYYKFVIEHHEDVNGEIKLNYYIATCYWELDSLKKVTDYIKRVFKLLPKSNNNEEVQKFKKRANFLLDFIERYKKNPAMKKRHFVTFIDIADKTN